jgi:hypothetical protein
MLWNLNFLTSAWRLIFVQNASFMLNNQNLKQKPISSYIYLPLLCSFSAHSSEYDCCYCCSFFFFFSSFCSLRDNTKSTQYTCFFFFFFGFVNQQSFTGQHKKHTIYLPFLFFLGLSANNPSRDNTRSTHYTCLFFSFVFVSQQPFTLI